MALPTQPPRFTRADGSPIRVLVVEDEPSLTGLLSMAMRYEDGTSPPLIPVLMPSTKHRPPALTSSSST
ncbi:two-component system response regulator [Cutibacterium acnes JCM 18909]|nr:two-component system response regulator [Cutibacterium acnes JCM 18909]